MNKVFANFACILAVVACIMFTGCDSSTSSNAEDFAASSSSVADNLSTSASVSSLSEEALSSSVVESSSSVAAPKTLCHIDLKTMQGYYPMAYNITKVSVCLPMDNCDSLTLELGFPKCYNDEATVEGCYSMASPKVVEACDESYDDTCETRNGKAYVYGALRLDCRNIAR